MKRYLLAAALLFCAATAEAQYPYYYPPVQPVYVPPFQYRYNYMYLNPSPQFPNGFGMYNYRVTPQFYQYNYGYPTNYQYGSGFRW